jgi:multidrug transporter EmrE-like cation transporter
MRILLTVFGALLNVVADLLLKTWADKDKPVYLYMGVFIYALDAAVFAYILKRGFAFVTSLLIWECVVVAIPIVWGVFVLKETFTVYQGIGLVLSVVAIFLLDT